MAGGDHVLLRFDLRAPYLAGLSTSGELSEDSMIDLFLSVLIAATIIMIVLLARDHDPPYLRAAMMRSDDVAVVDATGGSLIVTRLTKNDARMVELMIRRGGVTVILRLEPDETELLVDDLSDAMLWSRSKQ